MKVPLLAGFVALLVLLTADVVMSNRTIARAGFDDHLAQPVAAGVPLQKVVELLARK